MHKSQLAGFVIDCHTDRLSCAATFWASALGMKVQALSPDESGKYRRLMGRNDDLHIEVQSVAHASRVHLDIETDDIEAEVQRLERAGAKRIEKIKTWWVMQAPTGQRFCVVKAQSENFAATATEWPD